MSTELDRFDGSGALKIPRAPIVPPPPPEGTTSSVPDAALAAAMNVPVTPAATARPLPPSANSPAPIVAAPAATPPAPAQEPTTVYATDAMLLRTKVNGRDVDIPIADARKSAQLLSAAEEGFAKLGRQRAESQREIELGRVVLANLHNPQQLTQRLAEATGRPLVVNAAEAEDDATDPKTRALEAKLRALETKTAGYDQFLAVKQTDETLGAIRGELDRYPLYQQDPGEREHAELVVAAIVSKDMAMSRAQIAEVVGELHARRADTITRQTTLERDQRAADQTRHAALPASAGQPGLTENVPARISSEEWQKGPGAFKAGLDKLLKTLTP